MALTWPFIRELLDLRERLDRFFEEAGVMAPQMAGEPAGGPVRPAADQYETADCAVVILEVPGVDASSVDLRLKGDRLRVTGRIRRGEVPGRYVRMERAEGPFCREFEIPMETVVGRPSAQLQRGVLTVSLPRAPRSDGGTAAGVEEDE